MVAMREAEAGLMDCPMYLSSASKGDKMSEGNGGEESELDIMVSEMDDLRDVEEFGRLEGKIMEIKDAT